MGAGITRRVFLAMATALFGTWPWQRALADGTYTVKYGDTLSDIAARFNISVDDLMQANGITQPNKIYPGQVLVIPAPTQAPAGSAPPPELAKPPTTPGPSLGTKRLVSYYGNPWASALGILGEFEPDTVIDKLRKQAIAYASLSNTPVQPALHIIATVAQDVPGPDEKYRYRMPADVLKKWADLAAQNDLLLVLDLQPGRSTVLEEIQAIQPLLELPHVHLALDPEFNMSRTQVPGQQIGSMSATEVNVAQKLLSKIVATHNIPDKILIVHQFEDYMLIKKEKIHCYQNVQVAILMDGFGDNDTKIAKYNWLVREQPVAYGGIKLFYRWDTPLMNPKQVLSLAPTPDIIIYQ